VKKVFVKQKVEKNIRAGHPWCFSGAIESAEESIVNGELCEVFSKDKFLGIGYYNRLSDISLRIITRVKQSIDTGFFIKRFEMLKQSKEEFLRNTNAYRLVFGESDNLPGLVVDKYGDVLVVQVHTLGIELLKNIIVNALINVMQPSMIYERSDLGVRKKEGMPVVEKHLLYGKQVDEVEIEEHGFRFLVNVVEGQKTGFFLDQRENRLDLVPFCKGKKVLNCFSYTGGFSVYAASVCESVCSVDISKPAMEVTRRNFVLNGYDIDQHKFEARDVFDYLKELKRGAYDVIILDPPSFAKNRLQVSNAIKAYITINSKALEKLEPGGILVSSSCTAHVDELTFIKILHQSSVNTGCQLKVIKSNFQPFDHSYNLAFPEGRYLKFFIMQKLPVV